MARYRYRIVTGRLRDQEALERKLDTLGEEGWRAVGMTGHRRLIVLMTLNPDQHQKDMAKLRQAAAAAVSQAPEVETGAAGSGEPARTPSAPALEGYKGRRVLKKEFDRERRRADKGVDRRQGQSPRPLRLAAALEAQLQRPYADEDRSKLEQAANMLFSLGEESADDLHLVINCGGRQRVDFDLTATQHHYPDLALWVAAWIQDDLPCYTGEQQAILITAVEALKVYPEKR